jgi:photosystem II stability/assembly factor-like uncharacterized protein
MSVRSCLCVASTAVLLAAPSVIPAQTWTPTSAPRETWTSLASSDDGKTLAATAHDGSIFVSQNSGGNWAEVNWLSSISTLGIAPPQQWTSIALSADGKTIAAAAQTGLIFISADGGKTWKTTGAPTNTAWLSIASSADGARLVSAGSHSGIYVSADGGQTWAPGANSADPWAVVSSSSDGSRLLAAANPGLIYASSDSGATWVTSTAPVLSWSCLASSGDGNKAVAGAAFGGIYLSPDAGMTWTKSSAPDDSWFALASSSDGSMLAAAALYGGIYQSGDAGATWSRSAAPTNAWSALASSAKGKFVAAAFSDFVYLPEAGTISGNYLGLFYQTNGATLDSSGAFTATVTSNRAFSAKLALAGRTYRTSGLLPTNGPISSTVNTPGGEPLNLTLQTDPGRDGLRGLVSGGNWSAPLAAGRLPYSRTKLAPQAGRKYTIAMAAQDGTLALGDAGPGTVGYATLTVDAAANVSFKGKLADGVTVSQRTGITSIQQSPLCAPLYGNKGVLLGWLNLVNDGPFDLSGSVTWVKPAQPSKLLPAAFSRETEILGSLFNYTNSVPALGLNKSIAAMVNQTAATQSFTNKFVFANKVSDKTNKFTLTINSAGTFKGTTVLPGSTKRIPFDGVVLQRTNLGFGYLRLPDQEAVVLLGPAPPTISTNN